MEASISFGMALSLMQQLFAQEYLVDLNATQAAIRAGYSPATARSQGQRLLTNVDIEKFIQNAMDRRSERTGITADRVLQDLAAIGFASIGDYLTVNEYGNPTLNFENLTRDQMASIRYIKIESDTNGRRKIQVKMSDKLAALIVMGRHLDRNIAVPREALTHRPSCRDNTP
jgi:phage terminase small subunit